MQCMHVRVRVEIMGAPKCRHVGESQPVLMMINPMTFTRTRTVQYRAIAPGDWPHTGGASVQWLVGDPRAAL
jgi:hypothetical protein